MISYKNVFIIPVLNEEKSIIDVLEKTFHYVKRGDKVIVVDNNSTDKTISLIKKNFKDVEILIEEKRGKGNALRKGLKKALEYTPDFVITIDGDGENDPFDIPKLIAKATNSDAGMILGRRNKMRSFRRDTLTTFENFWLRLATGYNIKDGSCGLRVIKGKSLEKFGLNSESFEIEIELILECRRHNMKVVECPVSMTSISETGVKIQNLMSINRLFDKWVIRWINSGNCDLPLSKKVILFISCFIGLLI